MGKKSNSKREKQTVSEDEKEKVEDDSDDESASGRRCVALSSDVRVGSGKTLRFVSTEHSWRCSP